MKTICTLLILESLEQNTNNSTDPSPACKAKIDEESAYINANSDLINQVLTEKSDETANLDIATTLQ